MAKKSAGLLIYRFRNSMLEVFLVHPGGPFWKNKDKGVWSIPKGEFTDEEDPLAAAIREVQEETGLRADGNFMELAPVKLKSGKIVHAWAYEHDFDPDKLVSNTFEIEWPPRSGKKMNIPEVDRAAWFSPQEAIVKVNVGQIPIIQELIIKFKADK